MESLEVNEKSGSSHGDGREVEVTVYYQATTHQRGFKRNATVEDVLRWALEAFSIDPAMATELELALHGQTEELSGAKRIASLAGHCRDLAFDMIRGDIANGCSR